MQEDDGSGFRGFDDFISERGIDAPEDEAARHIKSDPLCMTEPTLSLDLAERGISTIIWATGYRPDYSWLHVPALDRKGQLRHDGGVCDVPGLYVMGLPFLRRRKSSFIDGAGDDANELAEHLQFGLRNSAD